jgi:hypothetical protein
VRLAADEWAVVLEALRRFALENEAVGRRGVTIALRAVSKLVMYRVIAGGEALNDEAVNDV